LDFLQDGQSRSTECQTGRITEHGPGFPHARITEVVFSPDKTKFISISEADFIDFSDGTQSPVIYVIDIYLQSIASIDCPDDVDDESQIGSVGEIMKSASEIEMNFVLSGEKTTSVILCVGKAGACSVIRPV